MEIKKTGLWFGRQAVRMCLMVLLVSILAFGLLTVSPIDPLQTNVGQTALGSMSPEQIAKLKSYWGTDLPPVERYLNWLKDFLHGNMGTSLLYRRPVAEIIGEKVMNSIWLLFTAWLFSGILGFFLGVLAGKKRGGIMDRIVTGYSLFVASTPAFWVAMVLLMVFAVKLHWFPIGFSVPIGMDAGQDSPCDSPGGGPQHHGNFLHRPAHEGKAHRGHGERLCAVRESQRRVGLVDLTSSWTSEHSSAGHDAAVRVGE